MKPQSDSLTSNEPTYIVKEVKTEREMISTQLRSGHIPFRLKESWRHTFNVVTMLIELIKTFNCLLCVILMKIFGTCGLSDFITPKRRYFVMMV